MLDSDLHEFTEEPQPIDNSKTSLNGCRLLAYRSGEWREVHHLSSIRAIGPMKY